MLFGEPSDLLNVLTARRCLQLSLQLNQVRLDLLDHSLVVDGGSRGRFPFLVPPQFTVFTAASGLGAPRDRLKRFGGGGLCPFGVSKARCEFVHFCV